ncbi:helix-turn-helix domain-containing protein [Thermogemmatispora onikobensis]|uniref:helix-turn-helix domain-containing protein n=1 Tax=Thermogemmatispora onikobensis TaxID=732234 RepID=UPI0008532884|nr:helix-turn-helix domain-containing protein [Thermogemmatispora onikobensis]
MTDRRVQKEEWLTATEAGKLIGVTRRTMVRVVERGEITGYRIASAWRFKRSDIEAYLEAHRYGPGRLPRSRNDDGAEADQEPD